jgi:cytochrome c
MRQSAPTDVNSPTGGALVVTSAANRPKTGPMKDNTMKKLTQFFAVSAVLIGAQFGSNSAFANPELMKAKNCTACHATDKKILGPAFKDIATKYATDAGAVATLAGRVKNGGGGVWGNIPMPANPQVSDAEAEALVKWIMTQK